CCMFIPHALGIRQGQEIVAKNSSTIAHNVNWSGHPLKNPGGNRIVPANQEIVIGGLRADKYPVKLACNIHGWMNAWVRVFDNPYFAVTDGDGQFEIKQAPAGTFRLVAWQESIGYVTNRIGIPVTIKANDAID